MIGKFQKHIWQLYYDFAVRNYTNTNNSEYSGGQGFNLGGRSIFWGSSIPELAQWELDVWPKAIQDYLLNEGKDGGYPIARGVFNSKRPNLNPFHGKATKILADLLGKEWDVLPAPVAVEYAGPTEWSVPAGIFSTADLLLEDAMAVGVKEVNRPPLKINTNTLVRYVIFDDKEKNRATAVRCLDLLDGKEKTYRAKTIVLSAGTLESTKIALNSNIPNVGTGITDHPIWYRHFVIPRTSLQDLGLLSVFMETAANMTVEQPRDEPQSTKILIRHKSATLKEHGFDIILELGAQFNQGRIVDKDHLEDDLKQRKGFLLCEIVFQFYAPLLESNSVKLAAGNDRYAAVSVNMRRSPTDPGLLREARDIATKILITFKAESVFEEDALYVNGLANLKEADIGGVAHEVGTLRMPVNGKKGVVDEDLKFEGYEGLYACDNSVFPCSPAGNPSLTLVALARRLAKKLGTTVK